MIRKYKDTDLEPMLDVWVRASRIAHPFLDEAFLAQERENIVKIYMPMVETWITENGGRVVGFLALIGDEVGAIFVDPAEQGNGFGRALMDHARTLRKGLELDVFKANAIGRRFYDRYGFVPVREYVHEATGQPVIRMKLDGDS